MNKPNSAGAHAAPPVSSRRRLSFIGNTGNTAGSDAHSTRREILEIIVPPTPEKARRNHQSPSAPSTNNIGRKMSLFDSDDDFELPKASQKRLLLARSTVTRNSSDATHPPPPRHGTPSTLSHTASMSQVQCPLCEDFFAADKVQTHAWDCTEAMGQRQASLANRANLAKQPLSMDIDLFQDDDDMGMDGAVNTPAAASAGINSEDAFFDDYDIEDLLEQPNAGVAHHAAITPQPTVLPDSGNDMQLDAALERMLRSLSPLRNYKSLREVDTPRAEWYREHAGTTSAHATMNDQMPFVQHSTLQPRTRGPARRVPGRVGGRGGRSRGRGRGRVETRGDGRANPAYAAAQPARQGAAAPQPNYYADVHDPAGGINGGWGVETTTSISYGSWTANASWDE